MLTALYTNRDLGVLVFHTNIADGCSCCLQCGHTDDDGFSKNLVETVYMKDYKYMMECD